jgi:amino acid adenylation domain-containing protein
MAFLLHHLLREAAQRDHERVAVRCRDRELTYAELDRWADGIAGTLADAGIRRGDRVGVHLPKSVEMVAAVYGVMRAGAAYVPLDPRAPTARLGTIARDCDISALISTDDLASSLAPELGPTCRAAIVAGPGVGSSPLAIPSIDFSEAVSGGGDPEIPAIDTDLAYILYTSGSTGIPKGVMLSHRHALTFVRWCTSTLPVGREDVFSNHAPLHFDLSVFDLYVSAAVGATVAPVPEEQAFFGAELASFAERESITTWYSVPSALTLMARALPGTGALPDLRTVVFAGEVFPTPELRRLRELLPDAELWNLYGPTETNVCTYYRVDQLPPDHVPIPIGRACENTEVFALRADGEVAGVGEEGELFVRGTSVMDGYWGRPDKTAEVLGPHPLPGGSRDLAYRTGDLVRLRPDGDYEFLGRRDHQIKSRGYRIELGDVEAALGANPDLLESAVVAVPHEEWGTAIVAWVVPRNGTTVAAPAVRRHVAGLIPRYMVPARIDVVDALPRTSNGKVDRRRILEETTVQPLADAGARTR